MPLDTIDSRTMYMSSSTRVKPREGFALLMALAFVAVMSMSLGALMTVISIPNKTFTTNSSRLLSTHEARMSAELLLKNIADNELVFQSLNLIQSANASSALAEWNDYCSSLTTAELRDVMNEAGLADVYAINPSEVSAAVVSGFVRRMFYSDLDNNSRDDDGNVGYLIIGCARRGDTASVQIIQAANTSGIWRLVRADAN